MCEPEIRDLCLADIYNKTGLVECLNQIAPCVLSKKAIEELYFDRQYTGMRTLVVVKGDYIIGTGTIIVEQKFIHNGGKVAHLEDISVLSEHQGFGIGKKLVAIMVEIAQTSECYKVILNCSNENYEFYRKCGFHRHHNSMRMDL